MMTLPLNFPCMVTKLEFYKLFGNKGEKQETKPNFKKQNRPSLIINQASMLSNKSFRFG